MAPVYALLYLNIHYAMLFVYFHNKTATVHTKLNRFWLLLYIPVSMLHRNCVFIIAKLMFLICVRAIVYLIHW